MTKDAYYYFHLTDIDCYDDSPEIDNTPVDPDFRLATHVGTHAELMIFMDRVKTK